MNQILVMVLDNPALLDQVLEAWTDAGARGITVLDSIGVHRLHEASENALPTFLGFRRLLRATQYSHNTLFTVADEETIKRVVPATAAIVGDLNAPDTGILFTFPVGQTWGLDKSPPSSREGRETV